MGTTIEDFDNGHNVNNWDGYGADPIKPETLAFAQKLAALLEQKPDDAPGGDGSICWEWRSGGDILCLDVQGDGDFRVYGRIAERHYHLNPQSAADLARLTQ